MADSIGLHNPFDLVIVHFVFGWVDRTRLLRTVAEVDRLLCDGGHLIIGDFMPLAPTRVGYHHLPDEQAYTYKQNYADVFLAAGIYEQICTLTGDHSTHELSGDVSDSDRIAVWLLRKGLVGYYADASFEPS
jgi:SAM-dependent methyltransferase